MAAPILRHETGADMPSERECLAELRTGDVSAFEGLFRAFALPLCSFACTYVGSRDVAEEIVQDVFCSLWEQRHTVAAPRGIRPYLYSAVRNRSLNALRNARSELAMHEYVSRESALSHRASATASPLEHAEAMDLSAAVSRVVSGMPRRCREVFTLLRVRQLSYAEVALLLEISTKTVEIHMTRALAILRADLANWIRP